MSTLPSDPVGFLNILKPHGITSREVVEKVQQHLRRQVGQAIKVGHSGTLDPYADGVLILGIGRATGLLQFLQTGMKAYRGKFRLGQTSETLDLESEMQSVQMPEDVSLQMLEEACQAFRGTFWQTPPKHSAIRIDGQRAYDLARKGKAFEVPQRQVTIEELKILEWADPVLELSVECHGGTYIRSLGRDIARSVGTEAVMIQLTRTMSGGIGIESAKSLEQFLDQPTESEDLLSPLQAMQQLPQLEIEKYAAQRLVDGLITHTLVQQLQASPGPLPDRQRPWVLKWNEQLVGVVHAKIQSDGTPKWKLLVNLANLLVGL